MTSEHLKSKIRWNSRRKHTSNNCCPNLDSTRSIIFQKSTSPTASFSAQGGFFAQEKGADTLFIGNQLIQFIIFQLLLLPPATLQKKIGSRASCFFECKVKRKAETEVEGIFALLRQKSPWSLDRPNNAQGIKDLCFFVPTKKRRPNTFCHARLSW